VAGLVRAIPFHQAVNGDRRWPLDRPAHMSGARPSLAKYYYFYISLAH
jgi:hypothetical protein